MEETSIPTGDERQVLIDQLGESLAAGVDDADEALEIAICAGLLERLDPTAGALADAIAWKKGAGAELLKQAFDELDLEELLDAVDGVCNGEATQEQVEDAVWDIDEVVAAAIWAGQRKAVRELVREVAKTVRDIPEPFAVLAPDAIALARTRAIAEDIDLYDYWLAIADAPPPTPGNG